MNEPDDALASARRQAELEIAKDRPAKATRALTYVLEELVPIPGTTFRLGVDDGGTRPGVHLGHPQGQDLGPVQRPLHRVPGAQLVGPPRSDPAADAGAQCAAQWRAYDDAYRCMDPYRVQGGGIKAEGYAACPVVREPACDRP